MGKKKNNSWSKSALKLPLKFGRKSSLLFGNSSLFGGFKSSHEKHSDKVPKFVPKIPIVEEQKLNPLALDRNISGKFLKSLNQEIKDKAFELQCRRRQVMKRTNYGLTISSSYLYNKKATKEKEKSRNKQLNSPLGNWHSNRQVVNYDSGISFDKDLDCQMSKGEVYRNPFTQVSSKQSSILNEILEKKNLEIKAKIAPKFDNKKIVPNESLSFIEDLTQYLKGKGMLKKSDSISNTGSDSSEGYLCKQERNITKRHIESSCSAKILSDLKKKKPNLRPMAKTAAGSQPKLLDKNVIISHRSQRPHFHFKPDETNNEKTLSENNIKNNKVNYSQHSKTIKKNEWRKQNAPTTKNTIGHDGLEMSREKKLKEELAKEIEKKNHLISLLNSMALEDGELDLERRLKQQLKPPINCQFPTTKDLRCWLQEHCSSGPDISSGRFESFLSCGVPQNGVVKSSSFCFKEPESSVDTNLKLFNPSRMETRKDDEISMQCFSIPTTSTSLSESEYDSDKHENSKTEPTIIQLKNQFYALIPVSHTKIRSSQRSCSSFKLKKPIPESFQVSKLAIAEGNNKYIIPIMKSTLEKSLNLTKEIIISDEDTVLKFYKSKKLKTEQRKQLKRCKKGAFFFVKNEKDKCNSCQDHCCSSQETSSDETSADIKECDYQNVRFSGM